MQAVVPLVATGLVLTACSGDDEPKAEGDSSSPAAASDPDHWPLTGVALPKGESAAKPHPIYVVKVENTDSGAPQKGIGEADMVVEELVEGGLTRLAAFYYENLPSEVEAVRSMRQSDVGIAGPVGATIVTSGAAGPTKQTLDKAGVEYVEEGQADGFSRDESRVAPYNVVADLKTISKSAKGDEARADDYFSWGSAEDFPGGKKATGFTANFGNHASQWTYQGGHYQIQNGHMDKGDAFTPDTVVVAQVKTTMAPYKDPSGADVPISHFVGKGGAWIFHDGKVVKGTWEKEKETSSVTFQTKAGEELDVPQGKVWMELVPKNGGGISIK